MRLAILLVSGLFLTSICFSQQIVDSSFSFYIPDPQYPSGKGPVIWVDAAHDNLHTLESGYQTFVRILREDGYQVHASDLPLDEAGLSQCRLLVIVNPLHASNRGRWSLPCPSAFTSSEIEAVRRWVAAGGSLLLVADHMPFPGASAELAKALGFTFYNGFATSSDVLGLPSLFFKSDESLCDHVINQGIDTVATFAGQAFRIPLEADPLLVFQGKDHRMLLPQDAWVFTDTTPSFDIQGWSQGAVRAYGQGRVAVLGEAAMFTAQLVGVNRAPAGMNTPQGKDNPRMLLNLIHWLEDQSGWEVPADVVKRIKVHNHGMEEAMRTKDALGVAGFYADEALILGLGGKPVQGREAINAYWEALAGLDWRLDVHALATSFETLKQTPFWNRLSQKPPEWDNLKATSGREGLVYQLGSSNLIYLNDDGNTVTSVCDFILVWQQQRDGGYRILVDSYVCR